MLVVANCDYNLTIGVVGVVNMARPARIRRNPRAFDRRNRARAEDTLEMCASTYKSR